MLVTYNYNNIPSATTVVIVHVITSAAHGILLVRGPVATIRRRLLIATRLVQRRPPISTSIVGLSARGRVSVSVSVSLSGLVVGIFTGTAALFCVVVRFVFGRVRRRLVAPILFVHGARVLFFAAADSGGAGARRIGAAGSAAASSARFAVIPVVVGARVGRFRVGTVFTRQRTATFGVERA